MMANPRITVLVPCSGKQPGLTTTLESLEHQSLSELDFEVVLLVDGGKSCKGGVYGHCEANSIPVENHKRRLTFRGVYADDFSLLDVRGEFITFLWEGDSLSRYFLETLLNAAEENVVPLSQVTEVLPSCRLKMRTPYNSSVLDNGSYSVPASRSPAEFFTEAAGKLIRRDWLTHEHVEYLCEADWLRFYVALGLKQQFSFSKFPASVGATYYRKHPKHLTKVGGQGSISVKESFRQLRTLQEFRNRELTPSQEMILSRVEAHYMRVISHRWSPKAPRTAFQTIADSSLRGLPWETLNEPVDTVVVVGNFAPYAGTAGIVAGKRIISSGKRVDVISSVNKSRDKHDSDLLLTEPYVRNHEIISPGLRGDNDVTFKHFIARALETLRVWQAQGANYRRLYSRAMVPHSHILGAVIKKHYPHWYWVAEFSDPLSVNAEGVKRDVSFKDHQIIGIFKDCGTREQQQLLFSDLRLYRWAELLPYFFADELIFTNENQLDIMLAHAPAEYREQIRNKAVVSHHPTLPLDYYRISAPAAVSCRNKVTLAYFGNFYNTRGLTDTIEALNLLDDIELHRFQLHIYTGSRSERIHSNLPERVRQIMQIYPRLDYLQSLATMNHVDYLIVNDADTQEYFDVNPYLPSKLSDYLGSRAQIWAIVEPGSVMSKLHFSHKSELGDSHEALKILRRILDSADFSE